MPAIVDVKTEKKVNLEYSRTKVFNFLANVENINSLFPKLAEKNKKSEETWQFKFQPVEVSGVNHAIECVVRITDDKKSNMKWEPPENTTANSKVIINWTVQEDGISNSIVTIELRGRYEVPVPRLMQRLAETVIKAEVEGHVNTAAEFIKSHKFA